MHSEPHIMTAFDRDLEAIQALIMKMGGLVEANIRDAAQALDARDEELAERVRASDRQIDALENQVHEASARLLAIRNPAATDLRVVLSYMRIAANLERIGDFAKNMGKRTSVLSQMPSIEGAGGGLRRMALAVGDMLKDALDAYVQRDAALAQDVRQRDNDVDQMYNALFRQFLTFMMEDPRSITACMHLHFTAKNIERMGDHVTAIAEQVVYVVTGRMPEEARPKADVTAFMTDEARD